MSDENSSSVRQGQEKDIPLKISEMSKTGYYYLKENKIDNAVDCFTKILTLDQNNNYALVGLGDAARKTGAIQDAIKYYQRCLLHHNRNNYALFGLADCFKILNQYQNAIEIWEQYLDYDDKNITVLTRIADAYRKVRNFASSKNIYLRVLEIEGNNSYAIIGLGHLHYDFKDYNEALVWWERMLKTNSANIDIRVLTSIGNCHRKLKTFGEGIKYFDLALQKEKNNFYALFGMADCYRGMNEVGNSLVYWKRILEYDPKNKMILTRAGDAYRNLNDYKNAQMFYEKALDIEFDTYAVIGLALISKAQGKLNDAITSFKRLIQNDAKNYRLYIELAECYLQSKNFVKAAETLEEFLKLGIKNQKASELLEKL